MNSSHAFRSSVIALLMTLLLNSTIYSAEQNPTEPPNAVEATAKTIANSVSKDVDNWESQELPPPRVEANRVEVDQVEASEEYMELPAPLYSSTKIWVGAKLRNDRPEILAVIPRSPAAKAGLLQGDLLESIETKRVFSAADVTAKLAGHQPGDQLRLIIWRGGSRWSAKLTLGNQSDREAVTVSR